MNWYDEDSPEVPVRLVGTELVPGEDPDVAVIVDGPPSEPRTRTAPYDRSWIRRILDGENNLRVIYGRVSIRDR